MKNVLPFLLILLFVQFNMPSVQAQTQGQLLIDSLLQELPTQQEDSNKVKLLNEIGWQHCLISNYDSAFHYTSQALVVGERLGFKRGIARTYTIIGNVYNIKGNYPEALKNYFTSLKHYEEVGDKHKIALIYSNIGVLYTNQEDYPKALNNFYLAFKGLELIGDKKGLANGYNNLGNVYFNMGNYSKALENYSQGMKLYKELGFKLEMASAYGNIGNIYIKEGKYAEYMKNEFEALKLYEELGDKDGIAGCYCNIGRGYRDLNRVDEAKRWLQKGIELGREIGTKDHTVNGYKDLAEVEAVLGNFKEAFENHKLYALYKDSLSNEENAKKQTQLEMQFEFDKKEAETKLIVETELNRQKLLRNVFIVGFAIVLLFALVFFRQRNKTKEEKQRSEALLLNILPADVAEELKSKGSAEAKQFDQVTVLFTDFKDFTQISEHMTAKELVAEIDTCFKAFDEIIKRHGIEKIKTIGDSYMCAGGIPIPNKTHAQDVVRAGLEIQQFIRNRIMEMSAVHKQSFQIRIGIHSGPVVAGIVGTNKFAYDIWGDTVNTASRMESSGEVGKVNISQTTYDLIKDKFTCTHRGKIQVKNKGEMDMYYVEGNS